VDCSSDVDVYLICMYLSLVYASVEIALMLTCKHIMYLVGGSISDIDCVHACVSAHVCIFLCQGRYFLELH
jgi:hypothetical protein